MTFVLLVTLRRGSQGVKPRGGAGTPLATRHDPLLTRRLKRAASDRCTKEAERQACAERSGFVTLLSQIVRELYAFLSHPPPWVGGGSSSWGLTRLRPPIATRRLATGREGSGAGRRSRFARPSARTQIAERPANRTGRHINRHRRRQESHTPLLRPPLTTNLPRQRPGLLAPNAPGSPPRMLPPRT